jgi:hypothetical protein
MVGRDGVKRKEKRKEREYRTRRSKVKRRQKKDKRGQARIIWKKQGIFVTEYTQNVRVNSTQE